MIIAPTFAISPSTSAVTVTHHATAVTAYAGNAMVTTTATTSVTTTTMTATTSTTRQAGGHGLTHNEQH
jgi:hypothetical protein